IILPAGSRPAVLPSTAPQRGVVRSRPHTAFSLCGTIPARPLYGSPAQETYLVARFGFLAVISAACQPVKARLAGRDALWQYGKRYAPSGASPGRLSAS